MIYTADYTLEIRRIVLENEVNKVYICKDKRSENGLFYTCICVQHPLLQKEILAALMKGKLFTTNGDYKGHFIYESTLNLLFLYHKEQLMQTYMDLYIDSFKKKKLLCKNLVGACQALDVEGYWLALLLNPSCINLNFDGSVYFNYFFDFRPFIHKNFIHKKLTETQGLQLLGTQVLDILADEHILSHAGGHYPKELYIFQKKLISGFKSYGEIYKYLNRLPDEIVEKKNFKDWIKIQKENFESGFQKYGLMIIMWLMMLIAGTCGFQVIKTRKEIQPVISETYKELYRIGNVMIQQEEEEERSK